MAILLASGRAGLTQPVPAKTGFFVTSISKLDSSGGSFDIDAHGWIVTPDRNFDPIDQLQVIARTSTLTVTSRRTLPDGSRYVAFDIEATVDQRFDLRAFPFDRQTLRLAIETQLPADRFAFQPDTANTKLADFAAINGWTVTGLRFATNTVRYDTDFGHNGNPVFSRLSLLIDIERHRSVLLVENFIGLTIALLITALIYLVPCDQIGTRIGLSTSAIFAAVGNRYGLDAVLGADTAFGLVDQLSLIVFASIYVALAISLLVYRLQKQRTVAQANRVDLIAGVTAVGLGFALAISALVVALD